MTEPKKSKTDDSGWIDALLDQAGDASRPDPSADLMARVLDDAYSEQPVPAAPVRTSGPTPRWRQAVQMIGGWGGVSGLVAATCAGFVIGIWSPVVIETPLSAVVGVSLEGDIDSAPGFTGFGWDLDEGQNG